MTEMEKYRPSPRKVDLHALILRYRTDQDLLASLIAGNDPEYEKKYNLLLKRLEKHRVDITNYVTSDEFFHRWEELEKYYNLGI